MRAKKNFIVVAYDVADDRRRSHVVKLLEKVGVRINLSVFECLLTDNQFTQLKKEISNLLSRYFDSPADMFEIKITLKQNKKRV